MKVLVILGGLSVLWACTMKSQDNKTAKHNAENSIADSVSSVLKTKYGGDDYGMQTYIMAFLYAGDNRDQDSALAAKIQKAHLRNIDSLAKAGVLMVAGPFLDDGELRGIFLFDVPSMEEAKRLTETDPAVKAGRLRMELKPWYGPAVARAIPELHKQMKAENPAN